MSSFRPTDISIFIHVISIVLEASRRGALDRLRIAGFCSSPSSVYNQRYVDAVLCILVMLWTYGSHHSRVYRLHLYERVANSH